MIIFLILTFILTRLLQPFQARWVWGDFAKHLGCAKTFPRNALFNKSYYDLHPAGFPYFIRLFTLIWKDYKAAVMVSVVSSIVFFIVSYKMFFFLGLPVPFILISLTYLMLNHIIYEFSHTPFRYSLFVCLFTLSLYSLLTGNMPCAVIFGGLAFFVADILPLPLLVAFILYGHPIACGLTLVFYVLTVLLPKFITYSRNEYYAGGVEGRLEKVRPFTLKQLISPFYFKNTVDLLGTMQFKTTLYNLTNKFFGVITLRWLENTRLNWLLIGLALLGLEPKLLIISLFIVYPIVFSGFLPRNSIAFVPIFAYFLGRGMQTAYNYILPYLKYLPNELKIGYEAFFVIFLLGIFIKFTQGNYLVFKLKKINQCDNLSQRVFFLPKDGILVEGLISQALAYHTKKRIIVLPRTPNKEKAIEQLNKSIEVFKINYIIISEFYKIEELPYPIIEYIKTSSKFKLIHTLEESYETNLKSDIMISKDKFFIYEIGGEDA